MRPARTLAVCAALSSAIWLSVPARAQEAGHEEPQCLLLGPLAVSSFLAFAGEVRQQQPDTIGSAARRTNDLVELYERLGCDMAKLRSAIGCLSDSVSNDRMPLGRRAEGCMKEAGMPVR